MVNGFETEEIILWREATGGISISPATDFSELQSLDLANGSIGVLPSGELYQKVGSSWKKFIKEDEKTYNYEFSKTGKLSEGGYLHTKKGLPSNIAGPLLCLSSGNILEISISTKSNTTANFNLFSHIGNLVSRISLADFSMTSTNNVRLKNPTNFTQLSSLTPNTQLGLEVTSGSVDDIFIKVTIFGTLV